MTPSEFSSQENLFSKQEIDFQNHSVEKLLEYYEAPKWVETVRQGECELDIEGTAAYVGIPVIYRGLGHRDGLTEGIVSLQDMNVPIAIHLSDRLKNTQDRLVFGHEMGHYFLATKGIYSKAIHDTNGDKAEKVSEAIGREFAIPLSHLEHIDAVDETVVRALSEMYKTDIKTVLYQLMSADKIPRTVKVDSYFHNGEKQLTHQAIICLDCRLGSDHDNDLGELAIYTFTDQLVFEDERRHSAMVRSALTRRNS